MLFIFHDSLVGVAVLPCWIAHTNCLSHILTRSLDSLVGTYGLVDYRDGEDAAPVAEIP